jgi:ATP-dependent Zn protease
LGVVNASEELGLNQLYGLGEARQFASDLIADIHSAMKGDIPWSQVDRGALLVGAPGTGKTTLAKAIAKDCGVRFINASATEWQATGQHLGHHIAAIRKTFAEARRYAPTILFIDEIDSIGNRETFTGYAAQYSTEVVNALLEQMQGVDPNAPVFVIGATNHEDRVDPALRRSGRLDRVIRIPRPNTESLALIYKYYLALASQKQGLDQSIDTTALGRLSLGLTGADLERIVRGAARRARREARLLTQNDLIAEITDKPRSSAGTLRLTPKQIERTAVHEAGHALAMFFSSSSGADIGFLTVVPREDGTLGFVAPMVDERVSMTQRDYKEKIQVYLAGRAAEEIRYGADEVTDGATNDLQAASALAVKMVSRLGLGRQRKLLSSEFTSAEDISAANDLLVEAYDRILERLRAHAPQLDALAKALAARQELSGDEAREILASLQARTASG